MPPIILVNKPARGSDVRAKKGATLHTIVTPEPIENVSRTVKRKRQLQLTTAALIMKDLQ